MADPIAQREQEEVDLILAAMQPGATPEQIRAATDILHKRKKGPADPAIAAPPASLEDRTDPSQAARRAMEAHSTAPSQQRSQPSPRFPRPDKIREGAAPPAQAMPPVKIGQ